LPVVGHTLASLSQQLGAAAQPVLSMALDGVFGILAGAAVLLGVTAFKRLTPAQA
jgi:hypothetical protein